MGEATRRHPYREAIETAVSAVAVALLFKAFVLEVNRIPSGSMQPTLMGAEMAVGSSRDGTRTTSIHDSVLVDRLSFAFREPQRFEVVVFRHPLARWINMVKRVVGLPGEELRIEHGDLWVRRPNEAWHIPRRPADVEAAMWRPLAPDPDAAAAWTTLEGGRDWRLGLASLEAPSPGRVRFRGGSESVRTRVFDGYPRAIREGYRIEESALLPVGDLRLSGELLPRAACTAAVVELWEGNRRYRFTLPGPAAPADARASIEAVGVPGLEESLVRAAAGAGRLDGKRSFAVQNLDDELRLEVDGAALLTLAVAPAPDQRSRIELELQGGGASLTELGVARDVYYFPKEEDAAEEHYAIPKGHVFVLGDNAHDSADSRRWQAVRFVWNEDGQERVAEGNFRGNESNPVADATSPEGQPAWLLRDRFGERVYVPWTVEPELRPEPYLPLELIHGRVFAVFWPQKPTLGIWRLAWVP